MLTDRTDRMIEELIVATYGLQVDARTQYLFSHALQGLVRLAKAEQLQAMRRDTERAAGYLSAVSARDEAEQLLRRVGMLSPESPRITDDGHER